MVVYWIQYKKMNMLYYLCYVHIYCLLNIGVELSIQEFIDCNWELNDGVAMVN